MFEVRKLKMDKYIKNFTRNRGSATIEACLVVPIILCIVVISIFLFLDTVNDSIFMGEDYTNLYTYSQESGEKGNIVEQSGKLEIVQEPRRDSTRLYVHQAPTIIYETDYDKVTGRLRRWQIYGDVFRDEGTQ